MLIETDPVPHYIIYVTDAEYSGRQQIPEVLKRASGGFMQLPVSELRRVFQRRSSGDFATTFPDMKFPRREDLLVFVSETEAESINAVEDTEAMGFTSCVYLQGGLASLRSQSFKPVDVKYINRHAVALLLGMTGSAAPVQAQLVDIRRMDEHVIFGMIDGSKALLTNEVPKALKMDEDEFQDKYTFSKPKLDDVVIMSCRTNRRAKWATALCQEAGYRRVFVHREGVFGWRFNQGVKVYDSYELGDQIPEPKPFSVEHPDIVAAWQELEELGLATQPSSAASNFYQTCTSPRSPFGGDLHHSGDAFYPHTAVTTGQA